jgi:hypothetical protein
MKNFRSTKIVSSCVKYKTVNVMLPIGSVRLKFVKSYCWNFVDVIQVQWATQIRELEECLFCQFLFAQYVTGSSFWSSLDYCVVWVMLKGYPFLYIHRLFDFVRHEAIKVNVQFTPEQATKAQREQMYSSTVPSTPALDGGGWSMPHPGHFTPGKDSVPIVWEAGWAPGPVWAGAENLAPAGIQSPYHPACNESLYWLRYPGPRHEVISALSLDSLKPRTCMLGWDCSGLQDPLTE